MKIQTQFSCGDMAWVFCDNGPRQLTIGQVRVECTDSPGYEDSPFHNYGAQKGYKEQYMCLETGVGSGTIWEFGVSLFADEASCIEANKARIEQMAKAAALAKKREIEDARRAHEMAARKLKSLGVEA